MKSESPFSKLPSLSELLQHPTVQGVVERVNQTTIAQRATGFLEELQSNWVEPGSLPSVSELAERLAHRLLGRSEHCAPTVNATGMVCSDRWHAPLAENAVRELLRFTSDYQQPNAELMTRVAASLAKLSGAESAWVASSFAAAASVTAQCDDATVEMSPLMGLCDPADFGYEHVDTISERISAGADLVVVDGSGLLGGPRCGIVIGKQKLIAQLHQSELGPALAADAMVLASLEATLQIYRTPDRLPHDVPVLQLLTTPLENLEQRCQRIAPLLAACDIVAAAEPVAVESAWLDASDRTLVSKSWAIALQSASGEVEQLIDRFEAASPEVVGRLQDDRWYLDFRAIFPRWDQHLVTVAEAAN
ncbi:MAG: hypothetical protein AAGD11_04970 [Planctomycetota bacterium]